MRCGGQIKSQGVLHEIAMMVVKGDLSPIKRLPSTQSKYNLHVVQMKRKYGSIENFIRSEFLGSGYSLVKNRFPYNVNALHLVLWTDSYATNEEIETILRKELGSRDYLWFEQTYEEKSIRTIDHVHVFIDND